MSETPHSPKHVVFFHPDLGIGGAERLIVDAAVGLQNRGCKVTIFTSHCDPRHCFEEARDGTLDVRVRGNTIIPPSFLNRFSIICAILRQIHLVLQISVFSDELQSLNPSSFFIDQLSACIPLLRLTCSSPRIFFYCHFPDKLLAARPSFIKSLYRVPFDWIECWSTGCSDAIVVNSAFTKSVFAKAFPSLAYREPRVLYPCVSAISEPPKVSVRENPWAGKKVILSINRFERKKDIGLAIRAYAALPLALRERARLIIAGGYDPRIYENMAYHKELERLAKELGLSHGTYSGSELPGPAQAAVDVLFMLSVPTALKEKLLAIAATLVYTPKFEHFGIVPLEAMLARTPVVAATTGGPQETVIDGRTGWLRSVDDTSAWTDVLKFVVGGLSDSELREYGDRGRERVIATFSPQSMAARIEADIDDMFRQTSRPTVISASVAAAFVALPAVFVGLAFWLLSLLRP